MRAAPYCPYGSVPWCHKAWDIPWPRAWDALCRPWPNWLSFRWVLSMGGNGFGDLALFHPGLGDLFVGAFLRGVLRFAGMRTRADHSLGFGRGGDRVGYCFAGAFGHAVKLRGWLAWPT